MMTPASLVETSARRVSWSGSPSVGSWCEPSSTGEAGALTGEEAPSTAAAESETASRSREQQGDGDVSQVDGSARSSESSGPSASVRLPSSPTVDERARARELGQRQTDFGRTSLFEGRRGEGERRERAEEDEEEGGGGEGS